MARDSRNVNKKNNDKKNILKAVMSFESEDRDDKITGKSVAVCVAVMALLAVLLFRFAYFQFIKGDYYTKKAYTQQNSWRTISAKRGTITDRNGNVLAISVSSYLVNVNQKIIHDNPTKGLTAEQYQEKIARGLSDFLNMDYNQILEKIKSTGRYKLIAEDIDLEVGEKIKAWIKEEKIKGVYVDEDTTRYYPNGNLASHLIGFTGKDDQGLVCGVEVALDSMLTGTDGRIITAVDAAGNELPYDEVTRLDPVDGYNAVMTIDATIQSMVEKALKETIQQYNVIKGGAIVVMQPDTCDVLAMASYPDFNLNDPYAAPPGVDENTWVGNSTEDVTKLYETVWRNKALTDTYEPGSTFKTITAAMGVEEGKVNKNSIVSDAYLDLSGWQIHCWRKYNDHGSETFADAVKNSCNPVFSRLALDLGLPKFYEYIESFGFKNKTGIVLSGEANSIFHTNPTEIDMAVTAFGQRVQITPIQLATAYCAIANGGKLMQPRIVKEITDSNGIVVKSYESQVVRQVISESTSKQVMEMLEQVVASGTGSNAYVSGYRVAGKTGTSQTTTSETDGRYIASFCGVAPTDDPEVVILVMLDHPAPEDGSAASGGKHAAPVAGDLIEKILTYMEVEKRYTEVDSNSMMVKKYVPNVSNMTVDKAIEELKSEGFSYVLADADSDADLSSLRVEEQIPRSNSYVMSGSSVVIYTSSESPKRTVTVPNLVGYSLAEAVDVLKNIGLNVHAKNIGTVVSQSIPEGTVVNRGSVIELELINNDTEVAG
ncbi:MAG: PASTA domain-containing protein [Ruminococcaceae bacterium]|nr:PASTA domain-containing protein [Oscillospiraceae bacterium]